MNQNPYAAPHAIVTRDFATTNNSRPPLVWVASFLLCAGLVFGHIKIALRLDSKSAAIMVNMPINYQILGICLMIAIALIFLWLTYKTWCGRNWARISVLIWIASGFIPSSLKIPLPLEDMMTIEYLTFAQRIAEVLGVFIVFATPARQWFARSRVAEK